MPPHISPNKVPHEPRIVLPDEHFYWALLDASVLSTRHADTKQLGYLFEAVLPVSIEEVQAVYARIGTDKQRYLACGMQRSALAQELANHPQGLLSISPSEIPAFIRQQLGEPEDVDRVPLSGLNLLVNDFEPAHVKTLRRRWLVHCAAALIVLTILMVLGMERRTVLANEHVQRIEHAKGDLYQQVLGPNADSGAQPAELRLVAELRTLRQTRRQPMQGSLIENDSTLALAALLAQWPHDVHVSTESLSITPGTMTIRCVAPSSVDVQKLVDALQHVAGSKELDGGEVGGWQVQQPQMNALRDEVYATVQLKAVKEQPSR